MIEYKGYTAVLEVDDQAGNIFGATIGMNDVVTFHGQTVDEAKACFRESVDAYLKQCAETGREPGKPFSGKFQVRIPGESHRALSLAAEARGVSLNEAVKIAITRFLEAEGPREPHTETVRLDASSEPSIVGAPMIPTARPTAISGPSPRPRMRRAAGARTR